LENDIWICSPALFVHYFLPGKLHEALSETDQYTGELSPVKWTLRSVSFAVDLVSGLLRLSLQEHHHQY
jgi:hypothetical protein